MRFGLVLSALLMVAVVAAVGATAVVVFPVFPLLKSGLTAVPGHLPSVLVEIRASGSRVMPVPARRNAQQTSRDLSPVGDDPAAPVISRVVPRPARAVPVPAVHEEDLLLVFRNNLDTGADLDQDGRVFKPDCRYADLDLKVDLRFTGSGKGD
jgi:hypothetical protein